MAEGLHAFRAHMAEVAQRVQEAPAPAKVQRFVRMHQAGLPLDITVRWYPVTALEAMEKRVEELTHQGRQVWISQGLPWDPGLEEVLASVEKTTTLLKKLDSVEDFRNVAVPQVQGWDKGSWAKLYYDTPVRSLTGGTVGFDTNRADGMILTDSRAVRLEAASGISDVRDLQRQMTARRVLVGYSDSSLFLKVRSILEPMHWSVQGIGDLAGVIGAVREIGPAEPRVVILDATRRRSEAIELVESLKASDETARIPLVLILNAGEQCPVELLAGVSDAIHLPLSAEQLRTGVFKTGFRVGGGASGFHLEFEDALTGREVQRLLSLVMGAGGSYRRMMMRVANLEARPTIAFEFKLVPIAPYEFFFLDYEWSGAQHPLHRFDWLYSFGTG